MPKKPGEALENALNELHALWDETRYAHIIKIEVPMGWDKRNHRPFWKAKTGFDYMGTLACGRSICVEAKATRQRRLSISKSGIKPHQIGRLKVHGDAGAIALVYWRREDIFEDRIVPYSLLWDEYYAQGRKSIPWDELGQVLAVRGGDYLAAYIAWESTQTAKAPAR